MESGLRYRKRKQRPTESDAFGGIFTRSRSQIYFHRHRSGYARADSHRSRHLIKSLKGTAKSLVKQEPSEATVDQITSQVSVKDLRARRVFSPDVLSIGEVSLDADFDVRKKNDGNPNVSPSECDASHSDLGVSESVAIDLKTTSENVVDPSIRENNVMEADDVQLTPTIAESDNNKRPGEKHDMVSVANEVADTKGSMSKSQSSVTQLRGRRKVFKSPSSFSYRRLLPFLRDLGDDDSSSFEIVEATLPKIVKSSNTVSNIVACKDEEIAPVSDSSKLADGLLNNTKSCEKQFSNSVNPDLISTVENSDVVQKSHEDVDTLDECEQMTPPDSDIYSKSKIDNILGVIVKPTSKLVLKSCSRMKVLQTPTSFSHRRLLPFLMSVAGDDSCTSKSNQSLKPEKATEQNQQPPTHSLLHQNEKSTTANEKSDSPTSTLIPIDTTIDRIKSVTLVSNDNLLDANGSISQLEVNLHSEAVKSDSCMNLEQSPPKNNLKCVEEATSETTPLRTEQSYSEDNQKSVKKIQHESLLQIAPQNAFGIQGENIKNGILKRTPRGCRGICNCLNCTSFRLHAERSFEFTRNQMHDAEEVALELINDLTCLRNILETTSSDSNSLDTVKEKQVKEACEKALYKEQVARARLAQMNEDLSIHCRSMNLLRPKVTFAYKIEEKVISHDGKKGV